MNKNYTNNYFYNFAIKCGAIHEEALLFMNDEEEYANNLIGYSYEDPIAFNKEYYSLEVKKISILK